MVNCASVHSNADPAMAIGVEIELPVEEKIVKIENPVSELVMGGEEELDKEAEFFFDSQPWIDSDCEDFFSVNGDCTPSEGATTPIHHPESSIEISPLEKTPVAADDDPPPTDTKKQLAELFRESFNSTAAVNGDENLESSAQPESSALKGSGEWVMNSSHASETTPQRGCFPRKQKSSQSAQCCLPAGLVRSLSFGERKKKLNHYKNGGW